MLPKLFWRAPARRAFLFPAAALVLLAGIPCVPAGAAEYANLLNLKVFGSVAGEGVNARGDLLLAADDNFYGTTYGGGESGAGTVYKVTPLGVLTVLHSFAGADGVSPYAGLTQAPDGTLYGTTYQGGSASLGSVYKITTSGTLTTLFSFTSASKGGFLPYTGVTLAPDGNFYGTTLRGGDTDNGTVYRLTPAGTVSTLVSFTGANGKAPEGRLVLGADGELYGTTLEGGASSRGVIYRVSTSGTLTVVYSFPALGPFNDQSVATNGPGANPRSGLIIGADGNFYGTAYQGGAGGFGTFYRLAPGGTLTVLHAFGGAPFDGANPLAAPVQLADGGFAGTTERGGTGSRGVAWLYTASGEYRLLHAFTGLPQDGATLQAGLLERAGLLYGVSYTDLTANTGAFFRLEPGTAGSLPVSLTVTPESVQIGTGGTLVWSAPGYASCKAQGAWTDTIATSGSKALTPPQAGIYVYVLECVDGGGTARTAFASQVVSAPPTQPVDGGGDGSGGGGALSFTELAALLLLAGCACIPARFRLRPQDRR